MSACPSRTELEQLLSEDLKAPKCAALLKHIDICSSCQDQLERLTDSSTPEDVAGAPTLDRREDTSLIEQEAALIGRLRENPPVANGVGISPNGSSENDLDCKGWPALAGYEILAELGRGGMSIVYKARHVNLNRVVALKMILRGAAANSQDVARFRTEAEAVARLRHPNIVQIFDIGAEGGQPYFSLEYMEGGTLAQRLAGMPLPAREAALLVETLARALEVAHEHHIIHRDLKPANILLTSVIPETLADAEAGETLDNGRRPPLLDHKFVKVADFGLAKALDSDSCQTRSGQIMGTPSYMAPEQAMGNGSQVGPEVDTYALGAILYEALTGRPPFRGTTVLDTLDQVRNQEPVPPTYLQPKTPRDLETICLKCLRKDPTERYPRAGALADDLRRFLAGEPVAARPLPPLVRLTRWARRRPALATLVALAFVSLLAGALGLIYHERTMRTALDETNRQREQALRYLTLARSAVNDFTTRVDRDPRLRAHDLEPLRRQLLQSALGFYQEFVQNDADQPEIQAERGRAYRQLALITRQTASSEEATHLYEQAVTLFAGLAVEHPEENSYRADLARSYTELATSLRGTGRTDDARKAVRQAVDRLEELVNQYPQAADYRSALAQALSESAELDQLTERWPDAEAACDRARRLWEELVASDANSVPYRIGLGASWYHLGWIYDRTTRRGQADTALKTAVDIRQRLADSKPDDVDLQADLGIALYALGQHYRHASQPAKARQALERTLEIRGRLAVGHPSVYEFQSDLAKTYHNIGLVNKDDGQDEKAVEAFGKARAILARLAQADPTVGAYRLNLSACHNSLAWFLFKRRAFKEAEVEYLLARDLRAELVSANPAVSDYRLDLASSYNNLSDLYDQMNRGPESESAAKRSLELYEELVRANPSVARYSVLLAGALGNRALTLDERRQYAQSLETANAAIRRLEEVLSRNDRDAMARRYLGTFSAARAQTLGHMRRYAEADGDWARALKFDDRGRRRALFTSNRILNAAHMIDHGSVVAEAETLAREPDLDGGSLYNLGCVMALTAAASQQPKTTADRNTLAEGFVTKAMDFLERARAKGYFKTRRLVESLKKDSDLAVLHGMSGWTALLARFATEVKDP